MTLKFCITIFSNLGCKNVDDVVMTSISIGHQRATTAKDMPKGFSIINTTSTKKGFPKTACNRKSIRATLLNEFPFKIRRVTVIDNRCCV